METETTTWSEFPNRGDAIVEEILASEEISKSKRVALWESQFGIQVCHLNKVVCYNRVNQVNQYTWKHENMFCFHLIYL